MLHYFIITCDKEHSAGGRINSLINDLDGKGCYSFAFAYLFSFDDKLVDASALVLNERVAKSCYDHMFSHCTGLRKVPQLPALSLEYSCYQNMFEGCQKLEEIPELPATTLADSCYRAMFFGCTSLVDASIELPAQILCNYCYKDMFSNCTNLTIPPILTAANYFAAQAYSWMFNACTSLTTAPSLPTANINDKDLDGDSVYSCFAHMFQHCRALTTPPALHSTTLPSSIWADGCYEEMFYGCSSLKVYSTSGEGHDKA